MTAADPVPLCIDLDGTLSRTDTLYASVVALLRRKPHLAALVPLWVLRGRARFKREIARRIALDVTTLPWNDGLLAFLREERGRGRSLWLVTAADRAVAEAIAAHLGIFDGVLASDGVRNLKAHEKAAALAQRFPLGFDYAGNAAPDLAVWRRARRAYVVNASPRVLRRAAAAAEIARVFP